MGKIARSQWTAAAALLAIGAAVTVSAGSSIAQMPPPPVRVVYEFADKHLKCDGDSVRITVTITRGDEPAKGIPVDILIPATDVTTHLPPTNKSGRTSGWLTPPAGSAASFLFITTVESGRGPVRHVGPCPFVPGPNTVDFSGLVIDELGRPVRGQRISAEITGPTFGSLVLPHWTRSGRHGEFKWEGIPASSWLTDQFSGQPRQVCLSDGSRFEIVTVNGATPNPGPGRCVWGFPLENQPVVFGLRRK